jgi:membrane fusion protein, multidrug efflux system
MEEQVKKKKPFLWVIGALVLILALFFGIRTIYRVLYYETTDDAQIESNATPVLSRIAGYIDTIAVKDYQNVKTSSLLVKIDDRELSIALEQAKADLMNARADCTNAGSGLQNANINTKVASATLMVQLVRLEKTKKDFERDQALYNEKSITQKQLLDSKAAYETAVKQYQVQKDELALANSRKGISNAQIEKALALIKTREAGVDNAKLKLSYTKIYAPVSGRVGKVNLQKGQYVQPGQPLFSIVNNEEFWIIANYKETQLKNLKAGQPVKIKIDGYPNLDIRGKISSFSDATGAKFSLLPPDNATGNFIKITQRVPVKITFDHPEKIKGILKAGLSVTVSAFIEK